MSAEEHSQAFLNETKQPLVVGIAVLFITLDTVCVALRFLSKYIGRLRMGLDDVLIVLGLIICAGEVTCTLLDVRYGGVGLHEARVKQIDPDMMITWGKFLIIIPIFYFSTVVPPKLVLLHLYLSIFTDNTLRKVCWATVAVVIANWIAVFITGFLACIPISYFWTGVGHCIDTNSYLRWGGFANILTDVVMLILPMPVVWSLHTSTRLKIGILTTFLLGSMGLIAAIVRFIEFYITDSGGDVTWNASNLEIWATIEGGIYMIAACLPTYRPLLRYISRRARGESQEASTGKYYAGGSAAFGGTAKSDNRVQGPLKRVSLKYSQMNDSMDEEEDAVRLVNMRHQRSERSDIAPGTIVVDQEFTVH
ncbi:hypothetical protein ASPWEDRAFT_50950 [Aspergillus wentii DTO 134E9]|uniref:Rhodopsin domain-containing protein n=1 Tax=Aspergillus wentii DTO 134E9 TaxID=1073089 RepID=A0A1L9RSX8_ASPWE|nr:uncharacterized protein ASPWEDRAFT_50950 [Aspergillus wentii DTO 134E9]KAI9930825.1 hypothetical protein MW887_011583 [Aspergillus wentii]OJJ38004.1 hypothetical protein ASPWEDRAFT_50950 [Aspergillus wentii DTO 134E9]